MSVSKTLSLRDGLKAEVLSDGIYLSGNTFAYKDHIKSLGATWLPDQKRWRLPVGADLSSLAQPQPQPQPQRQPYTENMWAYDSLRFRRNRACCSQCKREFDAYRPDGPMWFVCPVHGKWQSDYTGD